MTRRIRPTPRLDVRALLGDALARGARIARCDNCGMHLPIWRRSDAPYGIIMGRVVCAGCGQQLWAAPARRNWSRV